MAPGAIPGTGDAIHLLFLLFYLHAEKTRYPVSLHSFYTTHPSLLDLIGPKDLIGPNR